MVGWLALSALPLRALEITTERFGHVFEEGEPVAFTFQADGKDPVRWRVSEFEGDYQKEGEAKPGQEVKLEVPHRGLYRLDVFRGAEMASTTFAVVFPRSAGVTEGVGVFFTKVNQKQAENMYRMGITAIRLNFWFGQPEYQMERPEDPTDLNSGSINFDKNRAFVDTLVKAGFDTDGILLSIEGVPPVMAIDGKYNRGPMEREEFKWLIKKMAQAFPEIKYWEVWNEPDFHRFYTGTKEGLAHMTIDAYDALRELEPETDKKIAFAGFTSKGSGPRWLKDLLKMGIADKFDILTVHYTSGNQWDIDQFKKVMADAGVEKPIWNTEEDDPSPVGNITEGIPWNFKFIYAPADGSVGTSLVEGEDEHPTVHAVAMRTFSKMLSGATFEKYTESNLRKSDQYREQPAVRVAQFRQANGEPMFVAWHFTMSPHIQGGVLRAAVDPDLKEVEVTDDYGRTYQVPVENGMVTLDMETKPLADGVADAPRYKYYITGTKKLTPFQFTYNPDGLIVLEAETGTLKDGFRPSQEYGFSGNGKVSVFVKEGTPSVEMEANIQEAGEYEVIYLGTTLEWLDRKPSLVSPFRWRVGEGDWHEVKQMPPLDRQQAFNTMDTAGAHVLGKVKLAAGPQVIRLELSEPRGMDNHYFTRMDGLLLRKVES